MDEHIENEIEDILKQQYPVEALLRLMRQRMAQVEEQYHDKKTTHYVADMHLMHLVVLLMRGNREEDKAQELLNEWLKVAKKY